jgi:HTH-type transcriptional regulator/antitoxin HipB
LLVGLRRQRGLSQKLLAPKAGGLNQARLSALELHPGRFTVERLLMILAALDLVLVVRPLADWMNGERAGVSDLVFRTAGVITAV